MAQAQIPLSVRRTEIRRAFTPNDTRKSCRREANCILLILKVCQRNKINMRLSSHNLGICNKKERERSKYKLCVRERERCSLLNIIFKIKLLLL